MGSELRDRRTWNTNAPGRGSPARTWRRTAPSGATFWRNAPPRAVCRRTARAVTGTAGSRSSATRCGSPCTARASRFRRWAFSSAALALPARHSSRWPMAPVLRSSRGFERKSVRTRRSNPGGPAALERPCGRTAYCVDASGRRHVVELFRVPGGRSGGEKYLSIEAAETCPGDGRAR